MNSVILQIVVVLGIVIAGGFLLFFLVDILVALFNHNKDEAVIKKNENREIEELESKISALSGEIDELKRPQERSVVVSGGAVQVYDAQAETAEPAFMEEEVEDIEEEAHEAEPVEEKPEELTEQPEEESYIEKRRRELMERLARMNQEEEEEEDEEAEELEEEEEEVVDAEEFEAEEETEEGSDEVEEARRQLEEERAKSSALEAELADAKKRMVEQQLSAKDETVVHTVYLTEEQYEAKLAVLAERLKLNEKELRQCKKEYLPLRRVKKSLDNSEKKLARKEALVAKQKELLYGVNNYGDIDEERAKKLAEDLDLYDGLKLAVQHCKEVMEKNADRYPLLEKMFEFLTKQNQEIKDDIQKTQQELDTVRGEGSEQ